MKYLVFAWNVYYPNGGINDLMGTYDTNEEAVTRLAELKAGEFDFLSRFSLVKWDGEDFITYYNDRTE